MLIVYTFGWMEAYRDRNRHSDLPKYKKIRF